MRPILRSSLIAACTLIALLSLSGARSSPSASVHFSVATLHELRQDSTAKVWVNTKSHVYHCAGSQYYGNTKAGEYLTETQARERGNRPAYGRTCGPLPSGSVPLSTALPASPQVWLNTSSGVYHCPGSRYYGNTKRGKYMTEAEARAQAFRPAYGKTCR